MCRASWLGYRNIILILLKSGSDVNQPSADGRTPLMWACAKGDVKTVQLLIDNGAALDAQDKDGLNAFDVCVTKSLYYPALLLYKLGQRPKEEVFYKDHTVSKIFDFELFFEYLE